MRPLNNTLHEIGHGFSDSIDSKDGRQYVWIFRDVTKGQMDAMIKKLEPAVEAAKIIQKALQPIYDLINRPCPHEEEEEENEKAMKQTLGEEGEGFPIDDENEVDDNAYELD